MSLARGIQSAIFHYLSCAPCLAVRARKQRRQEAKRHREARKELYLQQPDLYMHPDPNTTNEHWREEIESGPLPRRTKGKKSREERCVVSRTGTEGSADSRAEGRGTPGLEKEDGERRLSVETLDDDNWNRRRYQREDEELWGMESGGGSGAGRPYASRSGGRLTRPGTGTSSTSSFYNIRAPPVNDLHPPIVTIPSSNPADHRWMLQPPPRAAIMAGKERANGRSRSGSGTSSRVALSGRPSQRSLQRQISARQLEDRINLGETPPSLPPSLSRSSSSRKTTRSARASRLQIDLLKANAPYHAKSPLANVQVDSSPRPNRERKDSSLDDDDLHVSSPDSITLQSTTTNTSPDLSIPPPIHERRTAASGFSRVMPAKPTKVAMRGWNKSDIGHYPVELAKYDRRENRLSISAADGTDSVIFDSGDEREDEDDEDESSGDEMQEVLRRRGALDQMAQVEIRDMEGTPTKMSKPRRKSRGVETAGVDARDWEKMEGWSGSGFGVSRGWDEMERRGRWSLDL